jgi:hypothetical protein
VGAAIAIVVAGCAGDVAGTVADEPERVVTVRLATAGGRVVGSVEFRQRRPAGGVTISTIDLPKTRAGDRRPYAAILRPGSCARPAAGRGYHLVDRGEERYPATDLAETTWSVDLYTTSVTAVGIRLIRFACGSHAGTRPLRTNSEPAPDRARRRRDGTRIVVTGADGRADLRPAAGGSRTVLRIDVSALNGSSDIPAHVRRGTCGQLAPSLEHPFTLSPDAGRERARTEVVLPIPFQSLATEPYVLEFHLEWFGDEVGLCFGIAPVPLQR